jgi:hypothetical protein
VRSRGDHVIVGGIKFPHITVWWPARTLLGTVFHG